MKATISTTTFKLIPAEVKCNNKLAMWFEIPLDQNRSQAGEKSLDDLEEDEGFQVFAVGFRRKSV